MIALVSLAQPNLAKLIMEDSRLITVFISTTVVVGSCKNLSNGYVSCTVGEGASR